MAIKPGNLGSKADPLPVPAAFANSMAAAIEAELNALLAADGLPHLDIDNSPESRDRRRLFAAISPGLARHPAAHIAAIRAQRPYYLQVSPNRHVQGPYLPSTPPF